MSDTTGQSDGIVPPHPHKLLIATAAIIMDLGAMINATPDQPNLGDAMTAALALRQAILLANKQMKLESSDSRS